MYVHLSATVGYDITQKDKQTRPAPTMCKQRAKMKLVSFTWIMWKYNIVSRHVFAVFALWNSSPSSISSFFYKVPALVIHEHKICLPDSKGPQIKQLCCLTYKLWWSFINSTLRLMRSERESPATPKIKLWLHTELLSGKEADCDNTSNTFYEQFTACSTNSTQSVRWLCHNFRVIFLTSCSQNVISNGSDSQLLQTTRLWNVN